LNEYFYFLDDALPTPNAIDLYDIKEIIRRLSGKKFTDEDLTKIAEAVDSFFFHVKLNF
jgi:hypothetical protein